MLKKLMIPALLLGAAFSAVPAQAAVRFGVGIGGPVYAPAYPYAYGPYYGYYGYPVYRGYYGPYFYGTWGHRWHGHYYRHWR
jgi:hypothetical protein